MVLITGDTHGDFSRIQKLALKINTSKKDDTIIILGDSGFNYYKDLRSIRYKQNGERIPIKFFCVHGNHEERAELLNNYKIKTLWGGKVLVEPDFPHIIFAVDGEVYNIPTTQGVKSTLVIGGAYSVDKYFRLSNGDNWYKSEQPSDKIKKKVERVLESRGQSIDIVLSHTCPYRYIPSEWFLGGLDQSTVDNSTELWLDNILSNIMHYEKWYCGHYHGNKVIDKIEFMFENIKEL